MLFRSTASIDTAFPEPLNPAHSSVIKKGKKPSEHCVFCFSFLPAIAINNMPTTESTKMMRLEKLVKARLDMLLGRRECKEEKMETAPFKPNWMKQRKKNQNSLFLFDPSFDFER